MMTDAEIMKGLACCGKPNSCVDCNFGKLKGDDCIMVLANNAIELINRQKAEIAEYQKHIDQDIIYQKAVEVEAIKGFAEKLKEAPIKMGIPLLGLQTKSEIEEYFNGILLQLRDAIDDLVKEMTEEKECSL